MSVDRNPSRTPPEQIIGESAGFPGVGKSDPILTIDSLKKSFGGLVAVNVEHLEIPRGVITALIGPNGAGKTTLFNLLTGFDNADSGTAMMGTLDLSAVPAYRRAGLGQVRTFQLTKALGLLTVMDNMCLGAGEQPGEKLLPSLFPASWKRREEEIREKALHLLDRFKLLALKDDFAASLSGGQRKLLEMARALMSDPSLIMLDEPMAGVNPALTESLLEHIIGLKKEGITVVFVEHDMHMVRHVADWVVVMAQGEIISEGPPATVMDDRAVVDAYLGSHQEIDLGVVTGRVAGDAEAAKKVLLNKLEDG